MTFKQFLDNPFANATEEKMRNLNKVMGILRFVIGGVLGFLATVELFSGGLWSGSVMSVFVTLIMTGGYVMLGLSLFLRKKLFTLIGFGLMFTAWLLNVFSASSSFFDSLGNIFDWGVYGYLIRNLFIASFAQLRNTLLFLSFGVIFFALMFSMNIIKVGDKFMATVKKFWFIPVLCFVLAFFLDFIRSIIVMFAFGTVLNTLWTGLMFITGLVCATYVLFVALNPYGVVEETPTQPVYQVPTPAPVQTPVQPVYQAPVEESPVAAQPVEAPDNASTLTEELKQYKALLDAGVITQEDFDAKKRQLLGL